MTREEIIKALKVHGDLSSNCNECPLCNTLRCCSTLYDETIALLEKDGKEKVQIGSKGYKRVQKGTEDVDQEV